jgi:hypothetical protein
MPTITFFRQARNDGGLRTGVDIDGETQWMEFQEPRGEEHDPALAWYVDLQVSGDGVPAAQDAARDWLLQRAATVQKILGQAAERLDLGFDPDFVPFRQNTSEGGIQYGLLVSAARRLPGRDIAARLRELSMHWSSIISQLAPLNPV